MNKKNSAFTLMELLIVVTITAILAMAILPTYQVNTTKAKLSNVVPVLDVVMHDLLTEFSSDGSAPSTLEGVSGTGAGGGYGPYVVPNLTNYLHYVNGQGWGEDGAMIALSIPSEVGRGIPGFVESTNGSDGAYNSIAMAFYDNDGTIMLYCGRWDSTNTLYVPTEYLPSGCDTDNIQDLVSAN